MSGQARSPLASGWGQLLVGLFALFVFIGLVGDTLVGTDYYHYYSYLVSLALDRDLLLFNEFAILRQLDPVYGPQALIATTTGYAISMQNVGAAVLWLPFFFVAHVSALAAQALGAPIASDGFSRHYYFWMHVATWFYGLATLALAYRLARDYVSARAALLATVGVAFGTPFFHYVWRAPIGSEIPSAFSVGLLLYAWQMARRRNELRHWLVVGALLGLVGAVRYQNLVFAVFPATTLAASLLEGRGPRLVLTRGGVLAAAFALGYAPALLFNQLFFGHPLASPYSVEPTSSLFFSLTEPHLIELLFSPLNGLFVFAPVLIGAMFGLWPLFRKDKILAVLVALAFVVTAYVSGSRASWWAGASFGNRVFLSFSLPFIVALAALLERLPGRLLYPGLALLLAWTYLLLFPEVAYFTYGQLFQGQWDVLVNLPALLASNRPLLFAGVATLLSALLAAAYFELRRPLAPPLSRSSRARVVGGVGLAALYVVVASQRSLDRADLALAVLVLAATALPFARLALAARLTEAKPLIALGIGGMLFVVGLFGFAGYNGEARKGWYEANGYYETVRLVKNTDLLEIYPAFTGGAEYYLNLGDTRRAAEHARIAITIFPAAREIGPMIAAFPEPQRTELVDYYHRTMAEGSPYW